ncbi:hypothetical protein ACVWYG_002573 [Pedobacter sp. UYEF25]
MAEITFKAAFGNEVKTVRLTQPHGGQGNYHIMIDNFYSGVIVRTHTGFLVYLNNVELLTSADLEALLERIEL